MCALCCSCPCLTSVSNKISWQDSPTVCQKSPTMSHYVTMSKVPNSVWKAPICVLKVWPEKCAVCCSCPRMTSGPKFCVKTLQICVKSPHLCVKSPQVCVNSAAGDVCAVLQLSTRDLATKILSKFPYCVLKVSKAVWKVPKCVLKVRPEMCAVCCSCPRVTVVTAQRRSGGGELWPVLPSGVCSQCWSSSEHSDNTHPHHIQVCRYCRY